MKKLLLTLSAMVLGVLGMFAQTKVEFNFANFGGTGWPTSYNNSGTYKNGDIEIAISGVAKQTQTITDCPVTKSGNVVVKALNGKSLSSVSFSLKQWSKKTQTAVLKYSTDGTNFKDFSPAVKFSFTSSTQSSTGEISATSIPDGTTAVQLSFTETNNQIGIASATYTLVGQSSKKQVDLAWTPESASLNLGDAFTAPTLSATVDGEENADAKAVVNYSSDNEDLLTVAEDGSMTLIPNVVGTATVTASIDSSNESFYATPAEYVIKVVDPDAIVDVLTLSSFSGISSSYSTSTYSTDNAAFKIKATSNSGLQINTSGSGNAKNSALICTTITNKPIKEIVVTTTADKRRNVIVDFSNGVWTMEGSGSSTQITSPSSYSTVEAVASADGKTLTFTPNEQFANFYLHTTAAVQITKVEVRYGKGAVEVPTLATPAISLGENNTVTLSCETEGAAIYYTTDGTAPTAESTEYTVPFTIADNAKTTVQAIAIKDGESSSVSKQELIPNVVANIAVFLTFKPTVATKIEGPLTVIYENGNYLYVKDAEGNYLTVFSSAGIDQNLTNGQVLASISGTYSSYNSLDELVPTAYGEVSGGEAVAPAEKTVGDITIDMTAQYVKLTDVTVTNSGDNYTATQDGKSIALYNNFKIDMEIGEHFTIEGIVTRYNTTVQLAPISMVGKEKVAAPTFNPAAGKVEAGTAVTISCDTEGATIRYTTDGTDPTAESDVYTEPIVISEARTIKAIATKADCLDSDIAEAAYTLIPAGQAESTFDFSNEEAIKAMASKTIAPSNNNTTLNDENNNLNGVTLRDGMIAISFSAPEEAANGAMPRWWTGDQVRVYKGCTIEINTSKNGYKITEVVFTSDNKSDNWKGLTYAYTPMAISRAEGVEATGDLSSETKTLSIPDGDVVTTIKFTAPTGKNFINAITVTTQKDENAVSGVENVGVDAEEGEEVYYDLRGVEVRGELAPGLYIRRQGAKATKVIIR